MELDDQLAALAAGELDDDTARALRARAAADPAIARLLARHEHLQALLTGWETPPLTDAAIDRLDRVVDEALDDLDDQPLADRTAAAAPVAATPADDHRDAAEQARVVDLGAARRRREERRGLPAWASSAAVAAVLLAVVGTGVIAGGGLFSASDEATDDSMADAPMEESDEMHATGLSESDDAEDEDMADESMDAESMDAEVAEESAALPPAARANLEIAEGELLALLDPSSSAQSDDAAADDGGADEAAADSAVADVCVSEALDRDTAEAEDRVVARVASGTYAGQDAAFVVVRTPDEDGDRFEVLAYSPTDCVLLARDEATR